MRRNRDSFQLQFKPALIPKLTARYSDEKEREAFVAGRRIARGDHGRANLEAIFRWKTGGRGISRLARKTDEEIAEALRLAIEAETERAAIAVLCGLTGVEIPVASAILTAITPERYTIIDYRALEALGVENGYLSIEFYLTYLSRCRELAKLNHVTLRELDRALWQWSKERSGR
jgi:hypothetical protein